MMSRNNLLKKAEWIYSEDIRPYVFVRPENRISQPGSLHKLDWFEHATPVLKNPLDLKEISFADRIYSLEERAFGPANMAMPRWVFYDCAVLPGFVAGFCIRASAMREKLKKVLDPSVFPASHSPALKSKHLKSAHSFEEMDWVPLSLFIIIPTMNKGEWVAHNLCSVNSLLKKEDQFYGLGFLSKAFGLWYANVEKCTGITQWGSPALKLHCHYGHMEIIGAYAPVHSHATTLTYRLKVMTSVWEKFFSKEEDFSFLENHQPAQFVIDPTDEKSMMHFQEKIERKEEPYFLHASEITHKKMNEKLTVYKTKIN